MSCTINAVAKFLQDLLVTQSDFVRSELMSLQQQLQALEERAHNIEADIRNSMSIGELAGTGKSDAIIKQDDVDKLC